MKTLVIVPTYNEKDNIPTLVPAILNSVPDIHVLIVDDNSPDGTGMIAEQLLSNTPQNVFVLHRQIKDGLGKAYSTGFAWALDKDYERIITMDADWSHNPSDIPRLLFESGHVDLVVGSRYLGGVRILDWPLSRLIISAGANRYVRLITSLKLSDCTSGFMCFTNHTLRSISAQKLSAKGYAALIELKYRTQKSGKKIGEIPIVFSQRQAGTPKMSSKIILEAVWIIWLFRFFNPRKDTTYFKKFLRIAPLSLSLWRTQEALALSKQNLSTPLLDLGCGFGEFSSVFFDKPIDIGIDYDPREIAHAQKSNVYKKCIVADARKLPLNSESIQTAFSISTLEHIPNVDEVFNEVYRILKPGGRFVFTVPTSTFNQFLFFPFFKDFFLSIFHNIFKHQPLVLKDDWIKRAQKQGFNLISVSGTISKKQVLMYQLLLPFSIPSMVIKKLTGKRFVFFPTIRSQILDKLFNRIINQQNMTDANILIEVIKPT
ncbi:glycosyltransferase [bacterium]|nr:glycosyltransferase [bacterium]